MDAEPVPPQQPIPPQSAPPSTADRDVRTWAMWCHLAALSGYVIPFGNIVGPLVVWQAKKEQMPSIIDHGKEAVNFHISVIIYIVGCVVAGFLTFGITFFLIPVIGIGALVLSVMAGIKANEGNFYKYPLNLRLIK
jgi:uncharacterized protein